MMVRTRANCISFLFALAFGLAVFIGTRGAFAQDDAATQMARERFKEGVQFFDQKQYDKARAAFLQAYALKKHPAVLLNLAQSELRSSHEADAAKHFAQYLHEEKNPSPAERQAAEAGLQAAKAQIVEVNIQSDTDDAELYVDGNLEGKTPLPGPVYVMPGQHNFELRKGDKSVAERAGGAAGQSTSVGLSLKTTKAKPTPPLAAPTPSEEPAPPAETEEGAVPQQEPTQPPRQGRKPFFKWLVSSPVGLVGTGLTLVGAGAGTALAFMAKDNYDAADSIAAKIEDQTRVDSRGALSSQGVCDHTEDWLKDARYPQPDLYANDLNPARKRDELYSNRVEEYQRACTKYSDNVDNADKMKTFAIVGWAVGGVALVGTIVYYFIDTSPSESGTAQKKPVRATIVPVLGPTERGFSIVGQF